jgi:hypothetical protein
MGKPIASNTMTTVSNQPGRFSGSLMTSTTCITAQATTM